MPLSRLTGTLVSSRVSGGFLHRAPNEYYDSFDEGRITNSRDAAGQVEVVRFSMGAALVII